MSANEVALAIQLGRAIDQGSITKEEADKYVKLGQLAGQNPDAERLATYRSGGSMDQEIPDLVEVEERVEGLEPKDRGEKDTEKTTKMREEAARLKTASLGQGQTYLQNQGMLAVAEAKVPEERDPGDSGPSLAQQKIGPDAPDDRGKRKDKDAGEGEAAKPRQGTTTTKDQGHGSAGSGPGTGAPHRAATPAPGAPGGKTS